MKQLSIEEKAKAYDEALEKARLVLQERGDEPDGAALLSKLFPHLRESDDERIRKEIIDFATKANNGVTSILANNYNFNKWIAWLEKQGDKDKPTYTTCSEDVQLTQEEYDKRRSSDEATIKEVEAYKKGLEDAKKIFEKQGEHANFISKIQVGDKVTRNENGVLVNLSQLKRVAKKDEKQGEQKPVKTPQWMIDFLDNLRRHVVCNMEREEYREYEGKILAIIDWLEKQGEQKPILDVEIPFGAKDSELQEVSYHIPKGFHAEIESNKVIIKKGEQKSAWSEKDETGWTNTMIMIKECAANHYTKDSIDLVVNWLKSIKDRYTWKPSEEQMKVLEELVEDNNQRCFYTILRSLYQDLKKLREE